MSYILNALRKSEQERLAQQPDTITDRILVNQPPHRPTTSKLIILLIISNIIVVACFFWFVRKEPSSPLPVENLKAAVPEKVLVKPEIVAPIKMMDPPITSLTNKSQPTSSPSIAELAISAKAPAAELPVIKSVTKKNTVSNQPKPDQIKLEIESTSLPEVRTETLEIVERKSEAVPEYQTIPFIFELPPDFRKTIPDFKINVFVYSEQPAERFVMVDMMKYTVGQRIKDSVELKEIRSDSLVVEFNNHTFQIKRP